MATITGTIGDETLNGTAGNDTIIGVGGEDTMYGGLGDDVYRPGPDFTYIEDTGGFDIVDLSHFTSSVYLTLHNTYNSLQFDEFSLSGIEQIVGTNFDDTFYGTQSFQSDFSIYAGEGNDTLQASGYATLELYGEEGDDHLITQSTGTVLDGGTGNDTISGIRANVTANGGDGDDTLWFSNQFEGATLTGGAGADRFIMGTYRALNVEGTLDLHATITDFDPDEDTMVFLAGGLATAPQNPSLFLSWEQLVISDDGFGNALLIAPDYTITLEGVSASELNRDNIETYEVVEFSNEDSTTLTGTGFNDYLNISGDTSAADGGMGDDYLYGYDARNTSSTLTGGAGDDSIFAGGISSEVTGGDGNDDLNISGTSLNAEGGAGDDTISVTGSDATLHGDSGDDLLYTYVEGIEFTAFGGDGNDTLQARAGENYFEGGDGNDSLYGGTSVEEIFSPYHVGKDTLLGGAGDDTIYGGGDIDSLMGGSGDDIITGSRGGDHIDGGDDFDIASYWGSVDAVSVDLEAGTASGGDANGDTLTGIEGLIGSDNNDTLTGDANDNSIAGGDGNDLLTGGDGADSFVFASGWNDDVITDFNVDEDVLDLSGSGLTYADLTIEQSGADTTISDGSGNTLTLEGVTALEVDNVNFLSDDFSTFFVPDTHNGESAMPTTGARPATVSDAAIITTSGTISGGTPTFFLPNVGSEHSAVALSGNNLNVTYDDDVWVGGYVDMDYSAGTFYGFGIWGAMDTLTITGETVLVAGYEIGIGVITGFGNTINHDGDMTVIGANRAEGISMQGSAVNNTGTMNIWAGDSGRAYGIYNESSLVDISNGGTITASGGSASFGIIASTAGAPSDFDNVITNSGAISADIGIQVSHSIYTITVHNSGTVTGATYALRSVGDTVGITVNNTGTLDGDVLFAGGNDLLTGGGLITGTVDGGAGDDTLAGGSGADTLDGGDGTDVLDYSASSAAVTVNLASGNGLGGLAAGDSFSNFEAVLGSAHNDVLTGDSTANTVAGGAGADTMDGGAGQDMLDYTASSAGVMVDLFRGRGRGGDAEGDRLSGFEDIAGSAHNDTLIGDAGDNRLLGGDGFDFFDGGAGADYIHGGGDQDRVNYGASATAVHVSLDAGAGYSGDAEGDVLIRIEELVGSDFGDTLEGSTGRNKFWGGDGDDLITANDGPDVLYGEAGNDTLNGGEGRDIIIGGTGNDSITGGTGNDIVETGTGSDILVYVDGHGGDYITDFDVTSDTLDLTAITGINSFADLNAEDGRMRREDGVFLHTSSGDFVFIAGVTIAEIETATIVN